MTSERIKEIQEGTAYPESSSVKQALLQVWNECEQERVKTDCGCITVVSVHKAYECVKCGKLVKGI